MPFCQSCGREVLASDVFCPYCGARLMSAGPPRQPVPQPPVAAAPVPRSNVWLALFLSFIFPGLGQLYVGQRTKGRWFIVIGVVLALSIAVGVGLFLYPLFWVYNMIDAFLILRKIDQAQMRASAQPISF